MRNSTRRFLKGKYVATYKLLHSLIAIALVMTVLVGCGPEQGASEQGSSEEDAPPAAESDGATQPRRNLRERWSRSVARRKG
jgi:hypothetical protein